MMHRDRCVFHKYLATPLIFLLASISLAQEPQDKPSLGVLSVEFVPKTTDAVQVELYTSVVRGTVVELARDSVDVIEGSKLDKLIQVNAVGCTNTDCLVQFAKKAQVDYLLETRVIVHKGVYSVNMKLASSKSSSLLSEKTVTYGSEAEAQKGLPSLSEAVVKSLVKGAHAHAAASDQNDGMEDVPLAPPPAGAAKVIVKFASVPDGAAVTVDGNFLCTTPCSKMVLQGDHRIGMGKDGFRQKKDVVRAERNNQSESPRVWRRLSAMSHTFVVAPLVT